MDNALRVLEVVGRLLRVAVRAIRVATRDGTKRVDDILPDESVAWLEYEAAEAEIRAKRSDP